MKSIYSLLEQRRDFLLRNLHSKRPAVIAVDSSADVTHWKLAIGKLLFEQDRSFRWKFIGAPGEPGPHSPIEYLEKELWLSFGDGFGFVADQLRARFGKLEEANAGLEWSLIVEALIGLLADSDETEAPIRHLIACSARSWKSAVEMTQSPDNEVQLPPNFIFWVRPGLYSFAEALQPVPQPKCELVPGSRNSRVGPFTCRHHFDVDGNGGNHSLDFAVMIGAGGVELRSRCRCRPRWAGICDGFRHERMS